MKVIKREFRRESERLCCKVKICLRRLSSIDFILWKRDRQNSKFEMMVIWGGIHSRNQFCQQTENLSKSSGFSSMPCFQSKPLTPRLHRLREKINSQTFTYCRCCLFLSFGSGIICFLSFGVSFTQLNFHFHRLNQNQQKLIWNYKLKFVC